MSDKIFLPNDFDDNGLTEKMLYETGKLSHKQLMDIWNPFSETKLSDFKNIPNKEKYMEKYYVPSIEEFHIGFEYEIHSSATGEFNTEKRDYIKKVFNLARSLNEIAYYISNQPGVVVRRLDYEDIVACGFTKSKYNDGKEYFYLNGFDLVNCGNGWFTIYEDKGADEYVFRGEIKNISQFKSLLTSLRILDDLPNQNMVQVRIYG